MHMQNTLPFPIMASKMDLDYATTADARIADASAMAKVHLSSACPTHSGTSHPHSKSTSFHLSITNAEKSHEKTLALPPLEMSH